MKVRTSFGSLARASPPLLPFLRMYSEKSVSMKMMVTWGNWICLLLAAIIHGALNAPEEKEKELEAFIRATQV